ncbi:MAG: VIT domain-containing protein [Candidatus Latescibacterota bacterium]
MKKLLLTAVCLLLPAMSLADGILIPEPWVPISIKYHRVTVDIAEQIATTHIDQVFRNESEWGNIEGTYVFPVPEGASISAFTMYVNGEALTAELLEADEARQIYENIVRQQRDPALLEYAGQCLWRARIFPFSAGEEKRIQLSYDEIIPRENGLCRYLYPLNTEKFSSKPLEDVSVTVTMSSTPAIKSIYSPSHEIFVEQEDDNHATVIYGDEETTPDRDFILYYALSDEDIALSLLTYREADADGFYLLLAAPKVEVDPSEVVRKRVIFTLDKSGSMGRDNKFTQAREALKYVLGNLNEGDQFNIVDYASVVSKFSETPLDVTEGNIASALQYVDELAVGGATDIDSALQQSLAFASDDEWTNMVLFLTDGLPTFGTTDHAAILQHARDANQGNARIFVFGVGSEVNTHLLDRLASEHHGVSDYVSEEDIEVDISSFYNKINSPVLADLTLDFGAIRVEDVYPLELPDMFQGSQIVQLGRSKDTGDATIVLSGQVNGAPREFVYEATFPAESTAHEFLPRLWATRKIGYLLDQIRLNGEDPELVEEVIALSRQYGVITPYTSFLILEDEPVGNGTFDGLTRSAEGADAVYAAEAVRFIGGAKNSNQVQSEGVKYVGTKSFFLRDGFWRDSTADDAPTRDIHYGDEAYFALLTQHPGLGRYLAIDRNVIVRFGDETYRIGEDITTLQEEEENAEGDKPGAFRLMPNYPNPFNAQTVIRFSLAKSASVQLGIYDLLGKQVLSLVEVEMVSGAHQVRWDGKDAAGLDMASGVYVCRLKAGGMTETRRMVLLR